MENQQKWDVFLSHNSQDKKQVSLIAEYLENCGLKPWFDKDRILGGDDISQEIKDAIQAAKSAAILVGAYGLGNHQRHELTTLEMRHGNFKMKIIPVLLPGVEKLPDNSDYTFLQQKRWVCFSSEYDEKALSDLVTSIKRELPLWAQRELERLCREKAQAELKLQEIEQKIKEVETQLGTGLNPQKNEALAWLFSTKSIVEKCAAKSLAKFPELNTEIKKENGKFEKFCIDLKTCLDFVYFAYKSENYALLDNIPIEFSLAGSKVSQEDVILNAHITVFECIWETIPTERLGEVVSQELKDYLIYLGSRLKACL